ncbi:MAG TPA: hypothetical protein VFB51_15795 [Solirubrobacterales bacterium]|nr:hypothetical protein [Solirubrobacterales bacterium]
MRKKLVAVLGVGAMCALLASMAYAVVGVTFKAEVKPNKAKSPAGLNVRFEASDPAAEQPPIMNRIVIKLNEGGQYNSNKFPRCQLAKLQARGPNGCPSKSKIGSGRGVGYAKPVVTDPVNAKLTIFNGAKVGGKDTILVYVFPDLGPTFVSVGKITKKRSGGFDYNLDFNIPPIKTLPSAPDASTALVDTKTPKKTIKKGKRKFSLIVTPKKCTGKWKAQGEFFFTTGEKVTTPFESSCKK